MKKEYSIGWQTHTQEWPRRKNQQTIYAPSLLSVKDAVAFVREKLVPLQENYTIVFSQEITTEAYDAIWEELERMQYEALKAKFEK